VEVEEGEEEEGEWVDDDDGSRKEGKEGLMSQAAR